MNKFAELMNSATFLLIAVGTLLGLIFPLGKMGGQAGVSPVVWSLLVTGGAAFGLLLCRFILKKPLLINMQNIRFYIVAGTVSLVIPNMLTFSVIPKLGSGFTGLLYTLSPLFTLALSSIWQVRMPNRLGLLGIACGFIGAVVVSMTRGEIGQPASVIWIMAGLCIPFFLAIGNVYRTMGWPPGAEPMELATGMNLTAGVTLFVLILIQPDVRFIDGLQSVAPIAIFAVVVAAAMAALHSRLQLVGGPTYLSQIGYIAAAIALLVGTALFGESYAASTWAGGVIILIGASLSMLGQRQSR